MIFIAHRGNNNDKNNNRELGLINSLKKDYIDGIELDVRMTKDKQIIINHNTFLNIENSLGFKNISKNSLKELKKYDYELDGNPYKIMTLNELLKKIKSNKIILIEAKVDNNNYIKMANVIYKIIKKYKNLNIQICSFNYEFACYFSKKHKNYKVILLKGYMINTNKDDSLFKLLSINYREKREINKKYYVWTLNEKKEFKKLKNEKNIIGIISDRCKDINDY
jgi:Glycerophosphoryl diester phosphodiesterase